MTIAITNNNKNVSEWTDIQKKEYKNWYPIENHRSIVSCIYDKQQFTMPVFCNVDICIVCISHSKLSIVWM